MVRALECCRAYFLRFNVAMKQRVKFDSSRLTECVVCCAFESGVFSGDALTRLQPWLLFVAVLSYCTEFCVARGEYRVGNNGNAVSIWFALLRCVVVVVRVCACVVLCGVHSLTFCSFSLSMLKMKIWQTVRPYV